MDGGLIVRFEPTHPAFAGHFPGNPLVPGALLLDHAARAVQQSLGVHVQHVVRAKFPAVLRPDVSSEVQVSDSNAGMRLTCADAERTYLSAIVTADAGEGEARSAGAQVPAGGPSMKSAAEIEALLPHGGDMVLIDAVHSWSATRIVCSTTSHVRAENPLRGPDGLSTFASIEYAAQAMALHGALTAGDSPQSGLLVSVRDCVRYAERLDATPARLWIRALTVRRDRRGGIYEFEIGAGNDLLVSGQVGAILMPVSDRT